MSNYLKYAPATAVLAMFAVGIPVFVHFYESDSVVELRRQHQTVSDLTNGKTAGRVERIFKDQMPVRNFSTGALNAISLGVFGEARKGIVAGVDDWYFSREELSWNRQSPKVVTDNILFVQDVRKKLEARGLELLVVLVPEKADIYSDRLGDIRVPEMRKNYYNEIRARLKMDAGAVHIPDLHAEFMKAKNAGKLYFKSDTHWTVSGAGVAAGLLATELDAISIPNRLQVNYKAKFGKETLHSGDLYKFEELSVFSSMFDLPVESVSPITATVENANADDLFGDDNGSSQIQVALVGTSYSANASWSFAEQIKIAAHTDIVNLAKEGLGPFTPMKNFLDNGLAKYPALKVVIWEIPLRYFDEPEIQSDHSQ